MVLESSLKKDSMRPLDKRQSRKGPLDIWSKLQLAQSGGMRFKSLDVGRWADLLGAAMPQPASHEVCHIFPSQCTGITYWHLMRCSVPDSSVGQMEGVVALP